MMSTDMLIEGERHDNDIRKRDFDTKDMEEVELVIPDEEVKEVKDDTFSKVQEDDGDKRSSSNTSGIFGEFDLCATFPLYPRSWVQSWERTLFTC